MLSLNRDLWSFLGAADAICITTNGYVKANGHAVMGRGCAREAAERFGRLPMILGKKLKEAGNVPQQLLPVVHNHAATFILSFPVKPIESIASQNLNTCSLRPSPVTPGYPLGARESKVWLGGRMTWAPKWT